MAKKSKPASELTDDEILRRVFPKRVAEELKQQVADSDSPSKDKDSE